VLGSPEEQRQRTYDGRAHTRAAKQMHAAFASRRWVGGLLCTGREAGKAHMRGNDPRFTG
jgi:hypothetical protein